MARPVKNVVHANVEALKKKIKEGIYKPQREWRLAGENGLVLITLPRGAGVFYLFYSPQLGGKARKLRLGEFGALSLADARKKASEARASIVNDGDPFAERHAQKTSMTFEELAEKAITENHRLSAGTRAHYRSLLNRDVYPEIGSKPALAVTSSDVAAICRKVGGRGALVLAQRTKTAIGAVYKWARQEGLAKTNPARDVEGQQPIKNRRTRSPSDLEIRALWRAMDSSRRLSLAMKLILRLVILTGQRRSEVCGARCEELTGADWIIASDEVRGGKIIREGRMKNGTEQRVYLSKQAAALFATAVKECSDGTYVFPGDGGHIAEGQELVCPHINPFSVTTAMLRLREDAGVDGVTNHDMRRAMGNWLKDHGYGKEVRDLMLNHIDQSVDGRHYSNSARMETQCREAWQAWADHVSEVVGSHDESGATEPTFVDLVIQV
jgi:integrase